MRKAPRKTLVWLTDGQEVRSAIFTKDVHGAWGWRDEDNYSHFRTYRPLGWQPYGEPGAPNVARRKYDDSDENGRTGGLGYDLLQGRTRA